MKTLCTWFKIEAWLLTVFHSETDNQIKNTNTIMKQYLWMYCSYLQNDWERWFFLTEFFVNNMKNESIDVMLFYVTYKQDSWLEFESWIKIDDYDLMIKWLQQIDVNNFADSMKKIMKLLQNKIIYAQVLQEWHVNKEWLLIYNYKIDDKIYLNEWNIKT